MVKSDKELERSLNSSKQPKIFNFEIPENYQKAEYTPLIKLQKFYYKTQYTEMAIVNTIAFITIETFGNDINTTYTVSEYVNDIIKQHNGRSDKPNFSKDKNSAF